MPYSISLIISLVAFSISLTSVVCVFRLTKMRKQLQASRDVAWQERDSARMDFADAWGILTIHVADLYASGDPTLISAAEKLMANVNQPAGEILREFREQAWADGWERGTDYAVAEPWDDRDGLEKNPYAKEAS